MTAHAYVVRRQSSGRSASVTFIVVRNPGARRVSTWPHQTRESAQAAADELNIVALILNYSEDPRPYAVRRAEAARTYYRGASHA